jgi:uncharacterized protein
VAGRSNVRRPGIRTHAASAAPECTSRGAAAQTVLGGVLATTFRPPVLPLVVEQWLPVGLAIGGTVFVSSAGGLVLARRIDLNAKTGILGTLPGAASGMLAMSNSLQRHP